MLTEKRGDFHKKTEIPIFMYTRQPEEWIKPMLLFIHGGAFIAGSTKVVENFCKLIAEMSGAVSCRCDYRLATEHYFRQGFMTVMTPWFTQH